MSRTRITRCPSPFGVYDISLPPKLQVPTPGEAAYSAGVSCWCSLLNRGQIPGIADVFRGFSNATFGIRSAHSVIETGSVQVTDSGEITTDQCLEVSRLSRQLQKPLRGHRGRGGLFTGPGEDEGVGSAPWWRTMPSLPHHEYRPRPASARRWRGPRGHPGKYLQPGRSLPSFFSRKSAAMASPHRRGTGGLSA